MLQRKIKAATRQLKLAEIKIKGYTLMLERYDHYADFTWPTKAEIENSLLHAMILKEAAENYLTNN